MTSSTAVAATWVGVPSRSRDLGKLEPGDKVEIPVGSLSSRNFAADPKALDKATAAELDELTEALGVATDDTRKGSKADKIKALKPVMTERSSRLPKRSPTKDVDLTAAVETTEEGVTVNAD